MVVRFNLDIEVMADKWSDEKQKQDFIDNFTDVVNLGLELATVPDWFVTNVSVEFEED